MLRKNEMHKVQLRALLGLSLILLFGGDAMAQVTGAIMTGVVTGPDGSAIPMAAITITNTATGIASKTSSNTVGLYEFPPVNPGDYRLEVDSPGFSHYVRTGITMEMQQRLRLDVQMAVGSVKQTVQVTATAPLIETDTASENHTLEGNVVQNLPIRGRNVYLITRLVPGGNITGAADTFSDPFDTYAPSDIQFNGAPVQGNSILMNGVVNQYGSGALSYSPPPDAVQELAIQTFAMNAAFGETSGSVTSIETKSGTNSPHGELYEYHNDPDLNANAFFSNSSGQPKPHTIINMFGGQIGGPVYIPKVYNGKNRTFFFFSYEGIRDLYGYLASNTVPTAAERTGNFSQALAANGSLITIYNPFTTTFNAATNTLVRTPFQGNIIPANMINQIAQNLLNFVPLPDLPGSASNYLYSGAYTESSEGYLTRVDHQFSTRHTLNGSFGSLDRIEFYLNNLPTGVTGWKYATNDKFFAFTDTYAFNPATLLVVRLGSQDDYQPVVPHTTPANVAALGFPQNYSSLRVAPPTDFPTFSGQDLPSIGYPTSGEREYTPDVRASITRVQGKHSLEVGYELRVYRDDSYSASGEAGSFVFNRDWTQGPNASVASSTAGFGSASLLLGTVSTGTIGINATRALQTVYNAGYIQDTWRTTSRLTLNLGLRYDYESPITERYNRMDGGFDYSATSPIALPAETAYAKNPIPQLAYLALTGGPTFVGVNSQPRGSSTPVWNDVMPRIGFAWQVIPNRVVVRAGYGLFYAPLRNLVGNSVNSADLPNTQTGFSASTSMATSVGGLPLNTLSNPYPTGQAQPTGASLGLATALGQSLTAVDPDLRRAHTNQFQFDTQYSMPWNMMLDLAYVGSRSGDLQVNQPLDGTPVQYLSLGASMTNQVPNPFSGLITSGSLSTPTISVGQLLEPYPQYTAVTIDYRPLGTSWYNAVQASLTKHFHHGLSVLATYTNSKTMQRLTYLYFSNPLEQVISPLDRPQRFVFSGEWDLPVGRGMRFGSTLPKPLMYVLGNWEATWMAQFCSGQPLGPWSGAIVTGATSSVSPTVSHWFDTAAFAPLPPYTVPTLSSYTSWLRANSTKNVDMTIGKDFPIHENVKFRLQAQFYNIFNTPQFAAPSISVTSAAFGQVTSQANLPRWINLTAKLVF